MNNIKNEKGITLIALIVTIIVLIILAAVTIYALTGENNIIEDVKNAKEVSRRAEAVEIMTLKLANLYAHDYVKPKRTLDLQEIANALCDDEDIEYVIKKSKETASLEYIDVSDVTSIYTKLKAYPYEFEIDETLRIKSVRNTEGETIEGTGPEEGPKDPVIADASGASTPKGNITGKEYVTWEWNEETKQYDEKPTKTQPSNWYDYENGKWANIKTTNNGLVAYWVWIPRYEYIVPTSETATEIQVRFIGTDKKEGTAGYEKQSDGTIKSSDGYTIHPAFTNGGNGGFGELDGIWVAKYEASSNTETPDTNYGGGNDKNLKVQVKPSVQSWRSISTKDIFTVCKKMTNEDEVLAGSTVDSHMMKNMEWGAVAILSQSKYGVYNTESSTGVNGDKTYQIWNNPNGYDMYKYIYTGYAGSTKDASTPYTSTTAPTNVYEYNTLYGIKASTTGTVYGIYDMAGGDGTYLAGCIDGQENTKFGVTVGDTKYIDLYTNTSNSFSNYDGAKIGDATKETKGWNNDFANFPFSTYPVFRRGRVFFSG